MALTKAAAFSMSTTTRLQNKTHNVRLMQTSGDEYMTKHQDSPLHWAGHAPNDPILTCWQYQLVLLPTKSITLVLQRLAELCFDASATPITNHSSNPCDVTFPHQDQNPKPT